MSQMRGIRRRYNDLAGTNIDRVAGISDGIFSVGMTLLVLGLVVPALTAVKTDSDLWHALLNLGPNLLIYTMSFMTLGIFWVGQGSQLGQLTRSNRNFTWIQLGFLFAVTLVRGFRRCGSPSSSTGSTSFFWAGCCSSAPSTAFALISSRRLIEMSWPG